MSSRNNLVILWNDSLHYFFFLLFWLYLSEYCQQAFGCLMEDSRESKGPEPLSMAPGAHKPLIHTQASLVLPQLQRWSAHAGWRSQAHGASRIGPEAAVQQQCGAVAGTNATCWQAGAMCQQ